MAQLDPADAQPVWSTAGTNTDPGAAKQAAGWVADEAPAAGHMNWLLNRLGTQAKFIDKVCKPLAFLSNRAIYDATDFSYGTVATVPDINSGVHVTYDALADRFYMSLMETTGDICWACDSADGLTWSTANNYSGTLTASASAPSPVVTNGTVCAVGAANKFYKSTDLTVANLDAGTAFATIDQCHGLVYDATDALWVAVGLNGADVACEWSDDNGATWNATVSALPATTAGNCIAGDGAGHYMLTCGDATNGAYFSSDGKTWTAVQLNPHGGGTEAGDGVVFNAMLNCFVAVGASRSLYFCEAATGVDRELENQSITGDVQYVISCPDLLAVGVTTQSNAAGAGTWLVWGGGADIDNGTAAVSPSSQHQCSAALMAHMVTSAAPYTTFDCTNDGGIVTGKTGTVVFVGASKDLNVIKYGIEA